MDDSKLGTLKEVGVRNAWQNEAQDFTPWLAANLERLADALKLDLEDVRTEVSVGGMRADIVARTPTDSVVVIENQLAGSDTHHLGQILAYVSGLGAHIVVWVATGFGEEHLSAIRWLNEHTVDPYAFFAVQVRVVQIGDSPLAPILEVLERPNDWEREVRESEREQLSDLARFRRDFWRHLAARIPGAPSLKLDYKGSNVWHRVDELDITVVQAVAQRSIGVYVIGAWGESEEDYVPRLAPYQEAMRNAFADDDNYSGGGSLSSWLDIDTQDRGNWNQMADWLDNRRRKYAEVFRNAASSHPDQAPNKKTGD